MGAINIDGRIPRIKSAITQRTIVYALGFFVLVAIFVFLGFKYRMEKQQKREEQNVQTQIASDTATSNRKNQEEAASDWKKVVVPPEPPPPANTPPPTTTATASAPAIDPEEQERREREKRRRQRMEEAMEGPTGLATGHGIGASAQGVASSPLLGGLPPEEAQRAVENSKDRFAKDDEAPNPADDILKASRLPAASRYMLHQGARIAGIFDVKAVSENPGKLTAQVMRDVYDDETFRYLLIPAGSKLIGEYNAQVGFAQDRLQVAWTRIIFPDGSSIDLGRMNGYDSEGSSGLHDQVDNHWKRIIAGALLTSGIAAAFQLSQNHTSGNSPFGYPSSGQVVAGAVGTQMQEVGSQLTARNLAIPPVINLRIGKEFEVLASKDIVFQKPYTAMEAAR